MPTLPREIIQVIMPFAQVFSERVWDWAQVLLAGAILAPGKRTVTAALRVMGLKDDRQYQNYHRFLNRAKWSGLVIYPKICTSRYCEKLTSSGKCEMIKTTRRRQKWQSDIRQNSSSKW